MVTGKVQKNVHDNAGKVSDGARPVLWTVQDLRCVLTWC